MWYNYIMKKETVKKVVKKEAAPLKEGEVSVYNGNGDVVRVYSSEQHGKDYLKLAKEFAESRSFTIK